MRILFFFPIGAKPGPELTRKGTSTKALGIIIDLAKEKRVKGIYSGTKEPTLWNLFEKHGFIREGPQCYKPL